MKSWKWRKNTHLKWRNSKSNMWLCKSILWPRPNRQFIFFFLSILDKNSLCIIRRQLLRICRQVFQGLLIHVSSKTEIKTLIIQKINFQSLWVFLPVIQFSFFSCRERASIRHGHVVSLRISWMFWCFLTSEVSQGNNSTGAFEGFIALSHV